MFTTSYDLRMKSELDNQSRCLFRAEITGQSHFAVASLYCTFHVTLFLNVLEAMIIFFLSPKPACIPGREMFVSKLRSSCSVWANFPLPASCIAHFYMLNYISMCMLTSLSLSHRSSIKLDCILTKKISFFKLCISFYLSKWSLVSSCFPKTLNFFYSCWC